MSLRAGNLCGIWTRTFTHACTSGSGCKAVSHWQYTRIDSFTTVTHVHAQFILRTQNWARLVVGLYDSECKQCVSDFPPGEHDVGVGVARAGACGAPFDSVDLFTMSLEVMDTGLLLHTPNLWKKVSATELNTNHHSSWLSLTSEPEDKSHL